MCNNISIMTQAIPTTPDLPLTVELITCDLCNHKFSYDPNIIEVKNTASIKCPRCAYNQTTVSKPRVQDIVTFIVPVALVYIFTISLLLINR